MADASISREQLISKFHQVFRGHPDSDALLRLLDRYGSREGDRERERVQLAILKLSAGDPVKLRHCVEAAQLDYRDVLAWAEYPEQMSTGKTVFNAPPDEVEKIKHRDREQYLSWLEKDDTDTRRDP
jgi:hypothetical protein